MAIAVASNSSGPRIRRVARRYGVIVKVLTLIRLAKGDFSSSLSAALSARPRYVVVTSRFGAKLLSEHLASEPEASLNVLRSTFVAIGPSTADEMRRLGLPVGMMPSEHSTEGMLKELRFEPGSTAVTIRSSRASQDLEEGLRRAGVSVIRVNAYNELCSARRLRKSEAEFSRDVVLGSSFEARCFFETLRISGISPSGYTAHCIGPLTAKEASALGFSVGIVANAYTFDGLFELLRGVGGDISQGKGEKAQEDKGHKGSG